MEQTGGVSVEDHRRSTVVPGRGTDSWLVEAGLPRSVLLGVQSSNGVVSPHRRSRLRWLSLWLCLGWTP